LFAFIIPFLYIFSVSSFLKFHRIFLCPFFLRTKS
jgi:hypothetical protein